jgi:hypothetical protein
MSPRTSQAQQETGFRGGEQLSEVELNFNSTYSALENVECPIPAEGEFAHLSLAQRKHDIDETRRLKSDYRWDQSEAARILEKFLMVEISRSAWFGEAEMVRTAKFDDYKNGVDLVLEWLDAEEKPIRLAVDLTSSTSLDVLEEKRRRIGSLRQIRYFRSDSTPNASISAPLVVLGIDAGLLREMAGFAEAHREIDKKTRQSFLPKQTFADHPLKYLLLEQATVQLESTLRDLVLRNSQVDVERIAKIKAVLAVLQKVNQEATAKLTVDPRTLRTVNLLRTASETHKKLADLD